MHECSKCNFSLLGVQFNPKIARDSVWSPINHMITNTVAKANWPYFSIVVRFSFLFRFPICSYFKSLPPGKEHHFLSNRIKEILQEPDPSSPRSFFTMVCSIGVPLFLNIDSSTIVFITKPLIQVIFLWCIACVSIELNVSYEHSHVIKMKINERNNLHSASIYPVSELWTMTFTFEPSLTCLCPSYQAELVLRELTQQLITMHPINLFASLQYTKQVYRIFIYFSDFH